MSRRDMEIGEIPTPRFTEEHQATLAQAEAMIDQARRELAAEAFKHDPVGAHWEWRRMAESRSIMLVHLPNESAFGIIDVTFGRPPVDITRAPA